MQDQSYATRQLIATSILHQQCQEHKMLQQGSYIRVTYIPFEDETYQKHQTLQLHRNNDTIQPEKQCFTPEVELEVVTDQKQTFNLPHKHLMIKRRWTDRTNILKVLELKGSTEGRRLDIKQKSKLIDKTIRKLILTLMTKSNYQAYVWKDLSLILDQRQEILLQIDPGADTGMNLLLHGDPIKLNQFSLIYQTIVINDLKQKKPNLVVSYSMKIRAIAKILLTLILHRHFELLTELPDYRQRSGSQLLSVDECLKMLQKRKDYFRQLLQHKQMIAKIVSFEKANNVNYSQFLRDVLVEEKQMRWQTVIQQIVAKKADLPLLSMKSQYIPLEKIMAQLVHKLVDKKGKRYKKIFKSLGLYDDLTGLFFALMSLYTSFAEQAMSYPDPNFLLYSQNFLDYMVSDQLFTFFTRLKVQQFDLRLLPIEDEEPDSLQSQPRAKEKYENPQKESEFMKAKTPVPRPPQYMEILKNTVVRGPYLQSQQVRVNSQQKFEQEEKQIYEQQQWGYVGAVSSNLGKLKMKIKKSTFLSENYYSSGFHRYQQLFK